MLPDGVLLEIFDFYQSLPYRGIWKWHLLVHVCQRWRHIAFGSSHRLNLQLLCTFGNPVRKALGIWPALPIVIDYSFLYSMNGITPNDEDDVIAALEHPDRVYYLGLAVVRGSQLGKFATLMQEPFPMLKRLEIRSADGDAPVFPAEFLGGSAPCLQEITLSRIPYPTLPALLLSASDFVKLRLHNIPPTGYISPEAMVSCLAALPRLETLIIEFISATPRPDQLRPSPVTRTVLPAVTSFQFKGASEYLEDLVARIDSPQVNWIAIEYLNQNLDFQVARLSKFIDRSVGPKLTLRKHAKVTFFRDRVSFAMYTHANHLSSDWAASTMIRCEGIDWQVSHMAQVLNHFSATLSTVVHLMLDVELRKGRQLKDTDDVEWLHLLRQFSAMQTLHLSQELAGHVALALEDITGEMAAEMLPSLDLIFLAGQPASSIEKFVAARHLYDHLVTVVGTETEFDDRLGSYVNE